MSPLLASVLLAWAALHAYAGSYSGLLYLRRRAHVEHLAFAVGAVGLSILAVGGALCVAAHSPSDYAHGQRLRIAGGAIAFGALVYFVFLLAEQRNHWLVRATLAWSAFGLMANLAGLFFDPGTTASVRAGGFALAPRYPEVRLLPLGVVFIAGTVLLTAAVVVALARSRRHDPDLRLFALALLPAMVAGLHDIVTYALRIRSWLLAGHAFVLISIAGSFLLLRRLIRSGDELRDRTRELKRSYEELRAVQEELVQKEQLAAVGELSAVIAHEVRNPLAALRNAAAGLRRPDLVAAEQRTLLGMLDEEADRLNRLVRDLLTYARPLAPQRKPLPVAALVDRAMEAAMRDKPEATSIEIDVELAGAPSSLHGDADLLRGAFVNIVENAVQAMPHGGVLTVRARRAILEHAPAIALTFHDTGEGMDTLVRSKARDPFFTTRPSGTGLGLAIVERVVHAHGGTVELESSYDKGTTVTVTLPQARTRSIAPLGR